MILDDLQALAERVVASLRAPFMQWKSNFESIRSEKMQQANDLFELRCQINDLRDDIKTATNNTHVGTSQCTEAIARATEHLTNAIKDLRSIDLIDDLRF